MFLKSNKSPILCPLPNTSKHPQSNLSPLITANVIAKVNSKRRNKITKEAPARIMPVKRKKPALISKKGRKTEKMVIRFSGNIPYFATVKENSYMFIVFDIPE